MTGARSDEACAVRASDEGGDAIAATPTTVTTTHCDVTVDGVSQGRDETDLRVEKAVVTPERLAYTIEWNRGAGWQPMQVVTINRLTGIGVSSLVNEHGGDTMRCRIGKRKVNSAPD